MNAVSLSRLHIKLSTSSVLSETCTRSVFNVLLLVCAVKAEPAAVGGVSARIWPIVGRAGMIDRCRASREYKACVDSVMGEMIWDTLVASVHEFTPLLHRSWCLRWNCCSSASCHVSFYSILFYSILFYSLHFINLHLFI